MVENSSISILYDWCDTPPSMHPRCSSDWRHVDHTLSHPTCPGGSPAARMEWKTIQWGYTHSLTLLNYELINPRRMHRRVTVVVLCVCLSVTKLTVTYLICESKVQCYKVPYGVPNAWFVWISPKMLYSPILASFADSKLLDFSPASSSMTLRINRTLCVARYIQ